MKIPEKIDGKKVTRIQTSFRKCSLKGVIIPKSVTEISNAAFYNMSQLETVVMYDSVTNLGNYEKQNANDLRGHVFALCSSLQNVRLSRGIEVIPESSFYNTPINSFVVPGSVKVIEERTFFNCESLESVIIEEGVEKIGRIAFASCYRLYDITIPKSVTELDATAFDGIHDNAKFHIYKDSYAYEFLSKKKKNIDLLDD